MTRFQTRLLLFLPFLLALGFASGQGRAQTAPAGRFAFADTTLLRDTLNLKFDGLFPLADSLQVRPDSLRAWSIRFRYSFERLLAIADSLAMPVDSVGPVMMRERLNPLSSGERVVNGFTYNSTYNVAQTSTSWINGADVNIVRGSLFLRSNTNITLDNYGSGARKSYRRERSSESETGWKFSPNLSTGGRATLTRFENTSQGRQFQESETANNFSLAMRTRQQPARGLTSEFNFNAGLLDVDNVSLQKNGLSHEMNGRVRVARGSWLTHDLQGVLSGNFSESNSPGSAVLVDTRDRSRNLRGTLGLFNSSPVSVNLNYNTKDVRVQNPAPAESLVRGITLTEVLTEDRGADMTVRLRRDNDRFVTFTQRVSEKEQASSISASAQNTRGESGFGVTGRYGLRAISLDANFNLTETDASYPRRSVKGGYDEDVFARSIGATLTWTVTQRVILKSNASVSLSSSRYAVIDTFNSLPADRDSYRQSYRAECLYNRNERFSTTVALEVARILSVNLPAASTAANSELRSYRAEWRWSHRLFEGLTATQRNQLSADYTFTRLSTNDRLSLDYSTFTTLNAVLTPRLQLDINHSARFQPSGNFVTLEDGLDYLQRADETNTYTLDARMSYSPLRGISLNLRPQYVATNRDGTVDEVSVPQRRSRLLTFQGGANLDIPVGSKGQVTGDINRNFRADRSTSYTAGTPRVSPLNEDDYWQGSLQLRWTL